MTYGKEIIDSIKADGIGFIPTDTIYGIVGLALSENVVEEIYRIKKRKNNKPLIILINELSQVKIFGCVITTKAEDVLKKVWPGRVSVVFDCPLKKFEYLHRGTKSLAFRIPKKKELLDLLAKTGPLVAPSANCEGAPPAKNISEAKKYFGNSLDFYVDGGKLGGSPSKLISIINDEVVVLRR